FADDQDPTVLQRGPGRVGQVEGHRTWFRPALRREIERIDATVTVVRVAADHEQVIAGTGADRPAMEDVERRSLLDRTAGRIDPKYAGPVRAFRVRVFFVDDRDAPIDEVRHKGTVVDGDRRLGRREVDALERGP